MEKKDDTINNGALTSRERMTIAMHKGVPDRVPVMCQLSIGHYLLNTDVTPARLWHSSEGFVEALVTLARRYRFDGILVNLPGHLENWRDGIERIDTAPDGTETVHWKDGAYTVCPPDDNVQNYRIDPVTGSHVRDSAMRLTVDEVEVDRLFYECPHTNGGLKYPYFYYDTDSGPRDAGDPDNWFPPHEFRTIDLLRESAGEDMSIHGEVFSPFTQLMELLGYENALISLITHPEKCRDILARFAEGAVWYGRKLVEHDCDAVLMSSAFAGGGFISRGMYETFVLPFEKRVWDGIRAAHPGIPCYTHTCGAIGDRLDLMEATGLDGIDTFDPPPLGTVNLWEAKELLGTRIFIKGNIDSVNTLLLKPLDAATGNVRKTLAWGKPGGAYILSTACSVAPRVEPEKLEAIAAVAETEGCYNSQ